ILGEASYDYAYDFHEGLAAVCRDKMWGYIDKTGTIVLPFHYDEAHEFIDGKASVWFNGKEGCISKNGTFTADTNDEFEDEDIGFDDDDIDETDVDTGGVDPDVINDLWETVTLNGKECKVSLNLYGLAQYTIDNKFGLIDEHMNAITDPVYDEIIIDENSPILVRQNTMWTYLNRNGTILSKNTYEKAEEFSSDRAAVSVNGKWGYIDLQGEMVITPQFDESQGFWGNHAVVIQDDTSNVIDNNGNIVLRTGYKTVWFIENDLLYVSDDEHCGIMNISGKTIVPCKYDNIGFFAEGLCDIEKNGKYGFVDIQGNIVIKPKYSFVGEFSEGLAFFREDDDMSSYGYIDKNGKVVIKPTFDNAYDFTNGYALVDEIGIKEVIDKNGDLVEDPAEFDKYQLFPQSVLEDVITQNGLQTPPLIVLKLLVLLRDTTMCSKDIYKNVGAETEFRKKVIDCALKHDPYELFQKKENDSFSCREE
ncbi:MAG: WG repeat-containing protein, partial [Fibrobacter sp.]|nr:WG repeat-containing protein [Fibrobacter sp.]